MRRFAAGEVDVLVATTVIEVGVDVGNATMMVILDADRFGISQLHQLRGRVGRGGHPGLCLLVSRSASPTARRRLERPGRERRRVRARRARPGDPARGRRARHRPVRPAQLAAAALGGAGRRGRPRGPRGGHRHRRERPRPDRPPRSGRRWSRRCGHATPRTTWRRRDPHHRWVRRRPQDRHPARRLHPPHVRPHAGGALQLARGHAGVLVGGPRARPVRRVGGGRPSRRCHEGPSAAVCVERDRRTAALIRRNAADARAPPAGGGPGGAGLPRRRAEPRTTWPSSTRRTTCPVSR